METKELEQRLDTLKTGLEGTLNEKLQKAVSEVKTAFESGLPDKIKAALKENLETLNAGFKEMQDWKAERNEVDPKNQKALDDILSQLKSINKSVQKSEMKTFGEVFYKKLQEPEIKAGIAAVRKGHPFHIDFKNDDKTPFVMDMKTMTATNLTGDGWATYRPQPVIQPNQKVNFRDLISTVFSDSLTYIQYVETGSTGSIDEQTEGSAKSRREYSFTEVKTVQKYIAGFAQFSKQFARNLPFLQNTLPKMLLRDFYKEENNYFIDTVASTATGDTTTAETDDVKQIIDYIANLGQSNFTPSYGVVNYRAMAGLQKLTYTNGYYQGSGGVMVSPVGQINIAGVPIIPAAWMNAGKVWVPDTEYIERIEAESVKIEFFEQDSDNVQKNLITARIECLEELNILLASSQVYATL